MPDQRAVLYGRISRERGRLADGTLRSNVQQEDETTQKANQRGDRIVSWDLDMDVSGALFKRPGFARALELFKSGDADVMIVPALDRFGRDMKVIYKALDIIESNGGYLVSVKDRIDDSRTEDGRQQVAMYGMFAQTQLDRIKSGWKWAHAAHVADGIAHRDCYGYDRDAARCFVPNPDEAPWVVMAFELRASGLTFSDVARGMSARGGKTRNGRAWSPSSVETMIHNRNYLGEIRYGDLENLSAHEPLVTPELFHTAQGARRIARTSSKNDSPLMGLVRCAGCRYSMSWHPPRADSGAAFKCKGNHAAGKCPEPVSIQAAQLEDHVRGWLARMADMPIDEATSHDADALLADVASAEGTVAMIEDDDELLALWGRDKYVAKLRAAKAVLDRAQAALSAASQPARLTVDLPTFDALALDGQRRILAEGIDCVFVRGRPGRGGRSIAVKDRVWICEAGDGPAREDLPRRGDAGRDYVMRPFAFPED